MPCPNCSHTLEGVGYAMFHCIRCGTFMAANGSYCTPALVTRCREFYAEVTKHTAEWHKAILLPNWHRLGIYESITRPEDRPQGDPR